MDNYSIKYIFAYIFAFIELFIGIVFLSLFFASYFIEITVPSSLIFLSLAVGFQALANTNAWRYEYKKKE